MNSRAINSLPFKRKENYLLKIGVNQKRVNLLIDVISLELTATWDDLSRLETAKVAALLRNGPVAHLAPVREHLPSPA